MKKVIIIGATSGIGRELAVLYAKNNCLVGVSGRRRPLLDTLQQEFPGNVVTECFEVTEEDNIESLRNLIQQLGGLDLLIYNSGYGKPSDYLDLEIDKQTTQINVNGFLEIVNFAFNYFVLEEKGQIAATSSVAGIRGNSFAPAYSASKSYMSIYMEGLYLKARRLKLPIYVTDIQPGFVKTKMAKAEKQFWVSSPEKAALQIYKAIENRRRRAYISRRWWLIAKLLGVLPMFIYRRIG